jgi:hypothetical protein
VLRHDTIYSIRPFKEKFAKKIYPSDTDKKYGPEYNQGEMRGRGTGWYGTGVYGFKTEEQAKELLKQGIEKGNVPSTFGYIRKFEIDKPYKTVSTFKSDALHEGSKKMYHHGTKNPSNDFMGGAKYEFERAGISVTDEEIEEALKANDGEQPINKLLRKKGYDGVIPSNARQNTSYGSVKFYSPDEEIPLDKTEFTAEEKERKKWYEQKQFESARYNREKDQEYFENKMAEIAERPEPVRAIIYKTGEKKLNKEERIAKAKEFYREDYDKYQNIQGTFAKINNENPDKEVRDTISDSDDEQALNEVKA